MPPQTETLDTVGQDLDEAREKLQAARQALQAAPQDAPAIRQAVARLEWMETKPERIESQIMAQEARP